MRAARAPRNWTKGAPSTRYLWYATFCLASCLKTTTEDLLCPWNAQSPLVKMSQKSFICFLFFIANNAHHFVGRCRYSSIYSLPSKQMWITTQAMGHESEHFIANNIKGVIQSQARAHREVMQISTATVLFTGTQQSYCKDIIAKKLQTSYHYIHFFFFAFWISDIATKEHFLIHLDCWIVFH